MSRYKGILEAANQGYKRRLSLIEAEQDKLSYAKAMLDVIPDLKVPGKGIEAIALAPGSTNPSSKKYVTKKLLSAAKKTEKDLRVVVDATEKIRDLKKAAQKAKARLEKQSRLHKEIGGDFERHDYAEVSRGDRLSLYSFYDAIWSGYLDELL